MAVAAKFAALAPRRLRPKDALVQEFAKLVARKDYRNGKRRCVVSGTKLVRDLGRRHAFREILYAPDLPIGANGEPTALEGLRAEARYVAEERSLRAITQLASFDGLIASLDQPQATGELGDLRLLLCLESVQDPGLMGTLLRTALAFQWQAVFFLPGCADPFDPLVVRASQGALFDLPYSVGTHVELSRLRRQKGLQLCVSHARGEDVGAAAVSTPRPRGVALLLREEYAASAAPPRDAVKIKVPDPFASSVASSSREDCPFDARSLDVAVAGGILMHHIRHFHYPQVSRSPVLASAAPESGRARRGR